ncbi:uncharacterized protein LOC105628158 isoform X2 [Jatropha curcas]|uniref:uncharacterized protein LOC105628158 isoform X2 n=1 Tax=Jatropha curcas TaxID=180498 RepID=UPI0009D672D7|nr:uncharacterized protein LOC105628158 isoform X2 [Jatropha curcas]
MESDLSLVEMSGEDDSLLSMANDDVSFSNGNSYFSCSPLLRIPRSTRSPRLPSPLEPSSSSCEDSTYNNNNVNKENVSSDKSEVPKLSIEPQKMKRKKKGGGYNLRKSLAWDRAFFTEEGVLDPLELSMLSGNLGKSNGETLSVIHEGRESMSGELDSVSDSSDLQALEDNLFKELPSSTLNEGRKIAGTLSPKLGSSTRDKRGPAFSATKRKVLQAQDINRSAAKRSGCPRPVASSSLKRPPNINTTKVATKDSRVSKLLATKSDPSALSSTSRSSTTSASHSKSNYNSKPVNSQKNVGLKSTSTNTKTARNNAKSVPAGKPNVKSTAQQARRNVKVSSVPETHSSSNLQLPQVRQANNSSEVVPAAAHPSTANDSNTSKIAVSFSQNASSNGGNMQHIQPQTTKPTGLRMPSPSLGFFGQSKPSGSYSLLQRSSQSCNLPESNIPNFSKASALNPIHQRPSRPSGNTSACPSKSHSVASTVDAASCGKIKTNLGLNNMKEVALQEKHNSESNYIMNHQQQMQNYHNDVDPQSLRQAEPCKIKRISCMDHIAQQSNNNEFSLECDPCEQLEKDSDSSIVDVSISSTDSSGASLDYLQSMPPLCLPVEDEDPCKANNKIVNQLVETQHDASTENQNVCTESRHKDVKNNCDKAASKVHEDQLSGMHEAKPETCKRRKPDTCEVDLISNAQSQGMSSTLFEDRISLEDLNKYNKPNADAGPKVLECDSTSCCLSYCTVLKPRKDGITGIDYESRGLHAGDAQMLVECSKNLMSTSKVDGSNFMTIDDPSAKSAEQAELPNSCPLKEKTSQENYTPLFNGFFLNEKCYEESQEKDVLQNFSSVESIGTDASGGELGSSNFLCSTLPVNEDPGLDKAGESKTGEMECLHVDNDLIDSADGNPVAENALIASTDSKSMVENASTAIYESNALASEGMGKSHMIVAVIAGSITVNDCCPNIGDHSGSELENPHVTSQISSVMQGKVASGMNDIIEHEDAMDDNSDSSATNFTEFSCLKTGNDACYSERGISIQHMDCSSDMHEMKEQPIEQAKLINSFFREAELVNQSRDVFYESKSFESGSQVPQSTDQCEIMENELAGVDNMIKETLGEDSEVQSLHHCLLTDSCNSNVSVSGADKYSLGVDDISRQPKEHPELQNLDQEVGPENHGLCSDDNLLLMNASIESLEKEILENVSGASLEQGNDLPSECTLLLPQMCNVGYNVDKNAEHPSMEPSDENIECSMDCEIRNDYDLDNQARPFNSGSSSETNGDKMPLTANTFNSKPFCVLNEKANETLNRSIQQAIEVNLLENDIFPAESEVNIHQSNGGNNSELQDGLASAVSSEVVEDATVSHKESVDEDKQDALVARPPPNAVPFSDEWLAAFEAAGEEILAKKSGAVQNSPPDKSLPEPGPWSPVRRKNNQGIGPYDCTKYTNTNIPSSASD